MCYDKRRSARRYELTVPNLCTCYFKASFINFYLFFNFWQLNFKIWVVITIHFMQHKEFILLNEKDKGEKVSINRLPIQIIFLKTVYS